MSNYSCSRTRSCRTSPDTADAVSDVAVVRTGDRTVADRARRERVGLLQSPPRALSAGYDRCCRDVGLTHTPKLLRDLHISGVIDLAQDCMQGVGANAWAQAERPASILQPHLWVSLFHRNGFTHEGASADPPSQPVEVFRGAPHEGRLGMSWTHEVDIATRFATEGISGRPPGTVYAARTSTSRVSARRSGWSTLMA